MMKEKISIESKEYDDRTEFRVKIVGKYPPSLMNKGMWERYLSRWVSYKRGSHYGGVQQDFVFTAHKKNWFQKYKTYDKQCLTAIHDCERVIAEYKQETEQPKTTNMKR